MPTGSFIPPVPSLPPPCTWMYFSMYRCGECLHVLPSHQTLREPRVFFSWGMQTNLRPLWNQVQHLNDSTACTTSALVYLHGYVCVTTQPDSGKLCWYGWIGLVRSSCDTRSHVTPGVLFLFFIQVVVAACCKVIFFSSPGCLIIK